MRGAKQGLGVGITREASKKHEARRLAAGQQRYAKEAIRQVPKAAPSVGESHLKNLRAKTETRKNSRWAGLWKGDRHRISKTYKKTGEEQAGARRTSKKPKLCAGLV